MNFLSWFLHMLIISGLTSATSTNDTDKLALYEFKNRITEDPLQIMNLWNDSTHFCNWVGIKCNLSNERVMILNLESQRLVGSIPPSIGNLTFLTGINLRNNSFHGVIPQEIGRLLSLQHLNFTRNSFSGNIPTNLTHCKELTVLDLVYNEIVGTIPDQLSSLSKMFYLGFGGNNITGTIPAWIGNFSSLFALSLAQNSLHGTIPHQLGSLSRLGFFQLSQNQILGTIPSSIFNISSIYYFSVTQNQLNGQLPPDIGLTLPNLEVFAGGVNNFSGPIPVSLANASSLGVIDFVQNRFTGTVPANLGTLQRLYRLNFDDNRLGNGQVSGLNFVTFLANCTSLQVLGLARNFFGGELPNSIANLSSSMSILTIGSNLLRGTVPLGIGNLVELTLLGLEGNNLSGKVPNSIGNLQKLLGLYLNVNELSGPIPSSLGNLTALTRLFMEENRLEGSIPPYLGNCQNLLVLNLSRNNLSGTIPKEIISLSSLSISLAMASNSLTGSIPFEVSQLKNLKELHLNLESLLMEGNQLEGTIPESLESLRGLADLDLSHNNLSGKLPEFLGKLLALNALDLSYNNFEGAVSSEGIFTNASAVSVLGNSKLCGGVQELHLPACSQEKPRSSRKLLALKVVIPVTILIILLIVLCSFAACYMTKKSRKRQTPLPESSSKGWRLSTSYAELLASTNGFSEESLIGSGSFGSVYKGVLFGDGLIVAVKVLNLQQQGAFKSFMDECNALRSIRHRNLLKILSACSSVDHQGNAFKCLIFEFMSNGNLDQWLHPRDNENYQTKRLNIVQRLDIAIDVASALDYLHHHCQTPMVHCDLKPSNILLDDNMIAHLGDFGLAKFLFEPSSSSSKNQTLSVGLKGSMGYIPPGTVSVLNETSTTD